MIKRHVPLENLILNLILIFDSLTHVLNTDFSYTRSFETEIHMRHLTYMKLRSNLEFGYT